MQKIRTLHLYLGCLFAPLLVFFAMSGICQLYGWHTRNPTLSLLSTLHTGHGLKNGATLSSPYVSGFVVAMALAFIVTTVLGVAMAFRFGQRKAAMMCLALGVAIPVILIVVGRPG